MTFWRAAFDEASIGQCEHELLTSLFWFRDLMYSCAFTMVFVILSLGTDNGLLSPLVSVFLLALSDRFSLRLECLSMTTSSGNNIQSSIGGDGAGWWMTTSFACLHFFDLSICFSDVWCLCTDLLADMLADVVDDGMVGWQRSVTRNYQSKVGCYTNKKEESLKRVTMMLGTTNLMTMVVVDDYFARAKRW